MKKDIPEIGDLTQGINDSDIILTHKLPEMLEKSSGLQDRMNGQGKASSNPTLMNRRRSMTTS